MKKMFLFLFLAVGCFSNAQQLLQYSTATSGTINVMDSQQDVVVIQEATLALSLTLALPANPVDAQRVTFLSTGGITTLSLTTVVGSIVGAITGVASNTPATYIFSKASNKWCRYR